MYCKSMTIMLAAFIGLAVFGCVALAGPIDPWADFVERYDTGTGATPGYMNPDKALGQPSTMTGDPWIWPYDPEADKVPVAMVNGPWTPDDLVSIADGGFLTVGFNEPVVNHPGNPFGIDLIVFGNAVFFTADWPTNQLLTDPAMMLENPGKVEVSADGVTFYEIIKPEAGSPLVSSQFPTHAFASAEGVPPAGTPLQDFTMPLDPALTLSDFDGLSVGEALDLYGTSAGGAGIDLDWAVDSSGLPVELSEISYVRISGENVEIDGFADVAAIPEPSTLVLSLVGITIMGARRYRKSARQGNTSGAAFPGC